MNEKLRALFVEKTEQLATARKIMDAADADSRDLTDDEAKQHDDLMAIVTQINSRIEREQALVEQERQSIPSNSLELPDDTVISGGRLVIEDDPKRGFVNYGDFASSVAQVYLSQDVDPRLRIGAAAPSTFGGEGVGADGGFMIPTEFSTQIWGMSLEEDAFLPLTDNMPIGGNSMTFPSDETTPWGTDGIRAYWEGEANAATATKPKIKPNTMRLKKLTALVPVSDELMADAIGLSAFLAKKSAESIRYKTNDAIMNGDGAGKPLGVVGHAAEISQAKETSQTADTIVAENVVKMFSRNIHPARSYWVINPDSYPQLPLMTIANQPVFTQPGSGIKDAPQGVLLGRPVIMSDTCQTLGDKNDINFIDFGSYRTLTKSGGIETATSMHLYFDASAMAFRAVFRIDGQPILGAVVTPPNSTITRSSHVTLAVRA